MTRAFDAATTEKIKANERNWDSRTPVHVASEFYGLAGDWDPFRWFAPFEWDDLGDLEGRDVLHLQCHLGAETVAFARKGARTVGLDISGESVRQARDIAAKAGDDVEYVHADVYDAVNAVGGRRFDTVYTGKGALCYLPDLTAWAEVVRNLLRPGGQLYLVEFHPLLHAVGPEPGTDDGHRPTIYGDYLEGRGAIERDGSKTYTDGPAVTGATEVYEWRHGVADIVNAVLASGLRLTGLRETDTLPWPRWSTMCPEEHGWFRQLPEAPRLPLLLTLNATNPA